ncbi:hypothetical protein C8R46DRAFT_1190622 [Mycena filopes]|nr:hypothetical protein C8R46DRAFT_1190622 [Mycena filopes]
MYGKSGLSEQNRNPLRCVACCVGLTEQGDISPSDHRDDKRAAERPLLTKPSRLSNPITGTAGASRPMKYATRAYASRRLKLDGHKSNSIAAVGAHLGHEINQQRVTRYAPRHRLVCGIASCFLRVACMRVNERLLYAVALSQCKLEIQEAGRMGEGANLEVMWKGTRRRDGGETATTPLTRRGDIWIAGTLYDTAKTQTSLNFFESLGRDHDSRDRTPNDYQPTNSASIPFQGNYKTSERQLDKDKETTTIHWCGSAHTGFCG